MPEFRIVSPYNENIELSTVIPDELKKYGLKGGKTILAAGDFGNLLFHHLPGHPYPNGDDRPEYVQICGHWLPLYSF